MKSTRTKIGIILLLLIWTGCGGENDQLFAQAVSVRKARLTELQTSDIQVRPLLKEREELLKQITALVGDDPPKGAEFEAKVKAALEGEPPIQGGQPTLTAVDSSKFTDNQKAELKHLEDQIRGMEKERAFGVELQGQIRILKAQLRVVREANET